MDRPPLFLPPVHTAVGSGIKAGISVTQLSRVRQSKQLNKRREQTRYGVYPGQPLHVRAAVMSSAWRGREGVGGLPVAVELGWPPNTAHLLSTNHPAGDTFKVNAKIPTHG